MDAQHETIRHQTWHHFFFFLLGPFSEWTEGIARVKLVSILPKTHYWRGPELFSPAEPSIIGFSGTPGRVTCTAHKSSNTCRPRVSPILANGLNRNPISFFHRPFRERLALISHGIGTRYSERPWGRRWEPTETAGMCFCLVWPGPSRPRPCEQIA